MSHPPGAARHRPASPGRRRPRPLPSRARRRLRRARAPPPSVPARPDRGRAWPAACLRRSGSVRSAATDPPCGSREPPACRMQPAWSGASRRGLGLIRRLEPAEGIARVGLARTQHPHAQLVGRRRVARDLRKACRHLGGARCAPDVFEHRRRLATHVRRPFAQSSQRGADVQPATTLDRRCLRVTDIAGRRRELLDSIRVLGGNDVQRPVRPVRLSECRDKRRLVALLRATQFLHQRIAGRDEFRRHGRVEPPERGLVHLSDRTPRPVCFRSRRRCI